MLEERLSTIERMHRRDEERRRLGGAVPAFVKPRPSPGPEQLAEAERQRQAGALPEDLFAGDEELQCLRTVYETRRAIRAEQRICLRALECAQQALADEIQQAEQELSWHVLADARNVDEWFRGARRAVAALAESKALLQAIQDAVPMVNQSPDCSTRIDAAVDQARTAFETHLHQLRLAYVDRQHAEGEQS